MAEGAGGRIGIVNDQRQTSCAGRGIAPLERRSLASAVARILRGNGPAVGESAARQLASAEIRIAGISARSMRAPRLIPAASTAQLAERFRHRSDYSPRSMRSTSTCCFAHSAFVLHSVSARRLPTPWS